MLNAKCHDSEEDVLIIMMQPFQSCLNCTFEMI